MRALPKLVAAIMLFVGLPFTQAAAAIIWDYSPATLGATGIAGFNNQASGQNFAESVSFDANARITGMDIYSTDSLGVVGDTMTIRIWTDSSGQPGSLVTVFTEIISVIDSQGAVAGVDRKHVDFTIPVDLAASTIFWIGMSGTSTNIRQMGLNTNFPDDQMMAQFMGTSFEFLTEPIVGDMAFRLERFMF